VFGGVVGCWLGFGMILRSMEIEGGRKGFGVGDGL